MPVMNVSLMVDEKTYAGIKAGVLEICGMAKNIESKRIAKHIPVVTDAAKEGASKAIDLIRSHKKETLIISGVLIVGGAAFGTVRYITSLKKKKIKKQFANDFQIYLGAARKGELTIDILNSIIESLNILTGDNPNNEINLPITASQFASLMHSIFEYTVHLAEANNINPALISKPKIGNRKTYVDLQYYLNMQKSIFEKAA